MASTQPLTVYETNSQIAVLVDMVDNNFELDDATRAFINNVRATIAAAAVVLTGPITTGVALDHGQLNAAIQLLQQAKNKACDAAIIGCETRKRKAAAAALNTSDSDAKKPKEDTNNNK